MLLNKKHILNYFQKTNIQKNDVIFLHGNSMALFQIKAKDSISKTNIFWNALIEYLKKDGTIIVPTFTYTIGKNKIYDYKKTKSKVGQFSEDFRKHFSETRSLDPIFSVSAYGKKKDDIKKLKYKNSFGRGSIFDFIYKKNARIICLGCELEVVTFLHYIEQVLKVPYRGFKKFNSFSLNDDKIICKENIRFYCRHNKSKIKYNLDILKKKMLRKNKITVSKLGRVQSYSFNAKDFFNIGYKILKNNNKVLIDEI